LYSLPLMIKVISLISGTLSQSIVYCPMSVLVAPMVDAMAEMSDDGPVMSDVPESTMALVDPEENEPMFTPSMSICQ